MGALILSSLLGLSFVRMFIERHAVRIECGELAPYFRFVQWGWIETWRYYDVVPFFAMKLPCWSYELDFVRRRYALAQHVLIWMRGRGWMTHYHFNRETE